MRRTDRLFEILQLFRGGRLLLGREIAERLEVSLRTVYRDIETLIASGIPIEGERGVGYILREPIFLPPLTLTPVELKALHLGMEIVRQTGDDELARAAGGLLEKVDAVLPSDRRRRSHLPDISVHAAEAAAAREHLAAMRRSVARRRVVEITYDSLRGKETRRRIRPLRTEYWGRVWTCTAWCEARRAFRVFRVDRIRDCRVTADRFGEEEGKTYADYLAQLTFPETPAPAPGPA